LTRRDLAKFVDERIARNASAHDHWSSAWGGAVGPDLIDDERYGPVVTDRRISAKTAALELRLAAVGDNREVARELGLEDAPCHWEKSEKADKMG
jgi:hypothetical protein